MLCAGSLRSRIFSLAFGPHMAVQIYGFHIMQRSVQRRQR